MTSIFINYRRTDTVWSANWLCEKLAVIFGQDALFQDVRDITVGDDFTEEIQNALESASVLLVLVGPKWLFAQDKHGRRRIDQDNDWVRKEIRNGLLSKACRVIPVFLDDADLPDDDDALPEDIRALMTLQRIRIRSGHSEHDVGELVEAIRPFVKQAGPPQRTNELRVLQGESALLPPVYSKTVIRPDLLKKLSIAMLENSIVTVGGLSGSGKTFLMASYLQQDAKKCGYETVFWHEAAQDESVEDMLSLFSTVIETNGYSVSARCKKLMALLGNQKGLLVIDDLQKASREAYAPLIRAANGMSTPCRLVLLSQTRVELDDVATPPFHLDVAGWDHGEVEGMLKLNGLTHISQYSREIAKQSGGLPFAVGLFCSLVLQYNHDPAELLGGAMSQDVRLKNWFTRIVEKLSEASRSLLPRLGLVDGQFNIGVVNELRGTLAKSAFDQLQRSYLVSSSSPYRWKVHDLAAALSREYLSDQDAQTIHEQLGRYFSRGLRFHGPKQLTEQEFFEAVRAYRHFRQNRTDMKRGPLILIGIAASAKRQGLYRLYADLSADACARVPDRDRWLDYHYAHCLHIMGYFDDALQCLGRLRSDPALVATPRLGLSVDRLYAEVLGSLGRQEEGLQALTEALDRYKTKGKGDVPHAQANSVLVWLYIRLDRLDDAERLNSSLLTKASAGDDKWGGAIAFTKAGMIQSRRAKYDEAVPLLDNALGIFTELGDKRGLVWCLTHLAEAYLHLKDEQTGLQRLTQAQRVANDIEECGADYRDVIARMQKLTTVPALRAILDKEVKRTSGGRRFRPRRSAV